MGSHSSYIGYTRVDTWVVIKYWAIMNTSTWFMKNLSDKCIEEITYNLKQEYYEANDIIFRKGDSVEKIYLVTRGEINLLLDIDGKSFELHRLYQG